MDVPLSHCLSQSPPPLGYGLRETQVFHPNGTIAVFEHVAPFQPSLREDESRRPAVHDQAHGGASRKGATVTVGGVELPVRQA